MVQCRTYAKYIYMQIICRIYDLVLNSVSDQYILQIKYSVKLINCYNFKSENEDENSLFLFIFTESGLVIKSVNTVLFYAIAELQNPRGTGI